jgi:ABC-2 type transport system ATP-binding protein
VRITSVLEPSARANSVAVVAEPAISVAGLRKSYGGIEAVAGVDLEVHHAEVFAFLGPNGAGKTTTVEILEGYRTRTAGDVRVLGVDPAHATPAWRDRIGIVLQSARPEPYLTVRETVSEYAGYYSAPRSVDETIEHVGLTEQADRRVGKLSGGQQRRLDVALALVGDPDLVFLDEPTTGFDPSARRTAWRLISGLRDLGKTVLLTTHYLDEAQELADRVAIISRGRIIAEGTPADLAGRDARAEIRFRLPDGVDAGDLPLAARVEGRSAVIASDAPVQQLYTLTRWAIERGIDLPDLEVARPSLEAVYLELTEPQ